jgi:hypothetical protein
MWDLAVLFKDLAALGYAVKRASGCAQARPFAITIQMRRNVYRDSPLSIHVVISQGSFDCEQARIKIGVPETCHAQTGCAITVPW